MPTDNTGEDSTERLSSSVEQPVSSPPLPVETSGLGGFPLYPVMIAAFPILSVYANNIYEVQPHEVWRLLGIALLGCLTVWMVLALLMQHFRKAALAAAFLTLLFFSYGHFARVMKNDFSALTVPLCLTVVIVLLVTLYKNRGSFIQATVILNLTAMVLLFPSCLTIIRHIFSKDSSTDRIVALQDNLVINQETSKNGDTKTEESAYQSSASHRPRPISPDAAAQLTDIYYIILDAYGRADSLKKTYGFDNTPFIHALESRGFYIADQSRPNYSQTGYCIPCYLNMNYLDVLLAGRAPSQDTMETSRKLIDNNAVAAFLRNRGYHYVYIWTGTEVTHVETADLELDDKSLTPPSSFEGQIFEMSALEAFSQTTQVTLGSKLPYAEHRAYIQTAFRNLNSVAKLAFPKFVIAHILAPHPPFVFGPNGEAINPAYHYDESDGSQLLEKITRPEYIRGYTGQLQYINKQVLQAVDAILSQSRKPPIIIIQGDHGSRMNMNWESQAKTDLPETFSILNAYLVPANVRSHLYDSITPVNTFRVLLSSMFGANYPRLADRNYFATSAHPFVFSEVTSVLRTQSSGHKHAAAQAGSRPVQ